MNIEINWNEKIGNWNGKNIEELAAVLTDEDMEDMLIYSREMTPTQMMVGSEPDDKVNCVICFIVDLAVDQISHIHWDGYNDYSIELIDKYLNAWKSYIKDRAA